MYGAGFGEDAFKEKSARKETRKRQTRENQKQINLNGKYNSTLILYTIFAFVCREMEREGERGKKESRPWDAIFCFALN